LQYLVLKRKRYTTTPMDVSASNIESLVKGIPTHCDLKNAREKFIKAASLFGKIRKKKSG